MRQQADMKPLRHGKEMSLAGSEPSLQIVEQLNLFVMTAFLAIFKSWRSAVLQTGCGLPADELHLPPQERTLTQLNMSAIERHFYSRQHEVSCPALMLITLHAA